MENRDLFLKEIEKEIRQDIRENVKSGIEKPESHYLNACLKELGRILFGRKTRIEKWIGKQQLDDEAYALWTELKQDLSKIISKEIRAAKAQKMKVEINAVTSKALITCAMKEAGLEFQYAPQQYRAKVAVKISPKCKVKIYSV